jgi:hypothetical protein
MRCNTIAIATALCWLIAAGREPVAAAEARHFSFAYASRIPPPMALPPIPLPASSKS